MPRTTETGASGYQFLEPGTFRIHDFATKKPFANFLPGIAGVFGTPMWVFTVNRGQAVSSFGTRDKDGAILEFFPANKAYQTVSRLGFRTFLKWKPAGAPATRFAFHEPFADTPHESARHLRTMDIRSHELVILERPAGRGIDTEVAYFTLPGEPIAALVRRVTLTNRTSQAIDLEILDGLPQVLPYGMNEFFAKQMSRTIEAWMTVENAPAKAPFFKLKVDASDRPEVTMVEGGNFYSANCQDTRRPRALDIIVDPASLFGTSLDFASPRHFFTPQAFRFPKDQVRANRTPCAFSFLARTRTAGYIDTKREENRRLIEGLVSPAFTVSASPVYDAYCRQTYLDNLLRGGMPLCLGSGDTPLVYYVYTRKHGDPERDYNRFLVEDKYFAQGDGNYRDVNQNRRCDVWFEPRIGDANLKTFLNLIQLDGFNPLVVKGGDLRVRRKAAATATLVAALGTERASAVAARMAAPFKPGDLYRWLEDRGWLSSEEFQQLLHDLAPSLTLVEKAEHGEGFWVDHWIYNLDLLESYLAVYPERLHELLLGSRDYTFFDNAHHVLPRDRKFHLVREGVVRQYGAVRCDEEKTALLAGRDSQAVRTRFGKGPVLRVDLLTKLVCLFANKLASLDPQGIGIEMEADKPSWYDALNGLPGLAGSSVGESFELLRLARLLLDATESLAAAELPQAQLPEEIHGFVVRLNTLLAESRRRGFTRDRARFHDRATSLKEAYRAATRDGVSGDEKALDIATLRTFLQRASEKIASGLERAFDANTGLCPTYYRHAVDRFRARRDGRIVPLSFRSEALPPFLEGPVHAMKVERGPARRKRLYQAVRRSGLFDTKLGMYKVNASIESESLEIGRARVFTPGWLENESIWLHMEYKYLLEVLRAGLHDEFFRDLEKVLIPFQPAERYGRSLLENSSFLVSSVFPDASLHGNGFVARLSGSTAEFVHMWLLMNVGERPFSLDADGEPTLRFAPTLPGHWFTEKRTSRTYIDKEGIERSVTIPGNSFAYLFLGKTLVVYANPQRRNTYGAGSAKVRRIRWDDRDGSPVTIDGDTIPAPYAREIRDGFVARIDIELC